MPHFQQCSFVTNPSLQSSGPRGPHCPTSTTKPCKIRKQPVLARRQPPQSCLCHNIKDQRLTSWILIDRLNACLLYIAPCHIVSKDLCHQDTPAGIAHNSGVAAHQTATVDAFPRVLVLIARVALQTATHTRQEHNTAEHPCASGQLLVPVRSTERGKRPWISQSRLPTGPVLCCCGIPRK